MRTLAFLAALVVGCAHADTILKNNGTTVGPVLSLDCTVDAGLQCSRATGSSTGSLRCASATTTTPGCMSTTAQAFSGAKTFNGAATLAGGVAAPVWVDGGVSGASLTTRNGFIFLGVRADGGVSYIEGDDPGGNIELGGPTASVSGVRVLTLGDVTDGGIAFASYRGSYATDHAWMDGGSCNNYTVSGITGPTCGDLCHVNAEKIMPNGFQLTCSFENADGGTGLATRVVVTRCCNDWASSCDPPLSTYHLLGIAQ